MVIARGDICWVDLGPIIDRGPAKRRPVLVVQSDAYTRTRLGTVVVTALTSNLARAAIPGNVFLPHTATGLPRDSVVITTELITLDHDHLLGGAGSVPPALMADVEAGLRRVLAL